MKYLLSGLLVFLGISPKASAQWQKTDITKIIYYSYYYGFFSASKETWMEMVPNGSMRMYNNTYMRDSTIENLQQRGSGTISVEEFNNLFSDDPLQYYFTDKLPANVYNEITDKLLRMYADTTRFDFNCCCDIPYETVTIHLRNGEKKKFMQCGTKRPAVMSLVRYLDELSHKPGYKKATTKFSFKVD